MSVTIEGVKGYEYQYKITALVSLLYNDKKNELFVEIMGSEDALLVTEQNGLRENVEIQVKRERNNIDISLLTNWLCHFQERKSNNNLLQKIIDNRNIIALFISHSRCSDDVVILKTDIGSVSSHKPFSVNKDWKNKFIDSLKSMKFGDTPLMKERKKFCENQSSYIRTNKDLSQILQQVLIWEEFSDEKVDSQVLQLLNVKYQISQSKAPIVYLKLLEVIKKGRDIGENIHDKIHEIIQNNKIGRPLIDPAYATRIEEDPLIDYITKHNALLLTGTTQCGKSELAKKISIHFFNKGYDYKITDDIEELKRFFSTNISDNKIAILEDPWGHITPTAEQLNYKRKIEVLVQNLEKHHKLIITSRIEILFEIFEADCLDECKIQRLDCQDVSIEDRSVVYNYWQTLSKNKSIPDTIIKIVSEGILNSDFKYLLQIGQLGYLVNEDVENLINKEYSDLEHIARITSKEIATSIKQKDDNYSEFLSIIAMCATSIHGINFTDLAYIYSNCTEKLSITNKDVFTSSFDNEDPLFPEYPGDIQLPEKINKIIEYFEERQFIFVSNEKIYFRHPNYYEAGRYLFISKSDSKQIRVLDYLSKCISCLSPINSYLATKQFSIVYNKIKNTLKGNVLAIAFESLDSIFPSVEDSSLVFLINFINELPEEQTSSLINKIQNGGTDSSNIYWHKNKIPFISNKGGVWSFFIDADPQIIKKVEGELSQKILPNIHDAWVFVQSLKQGKSVSFDSLKILLQYNEAFVREEVGYQVFNRLDVDSCEMASIVFEDEHPSVVFSAVRGAFLNWFNYSNDLKKVLLGLIKTSLTKKQVAIRAYNLISTFAIDYGHESMFNWHEFNDKQKKELWNLWGELYQITLEKIPLGANVNTARFGSTMDDAMEYLDSNTGMGVFESWFKRIDYQISNNKLLDEFEMSVADHLMKFTADDFVTRKHIFSRLINYNDTNFVLSNLKWISSHWNRLDNSEKKQIINLLDSDRIDLRWIKAVLLNSYSPPSELVSHILGEAQLREDNIESILSKFPDQLLKDCLNVYCGSPQAFWWLAVHHRNGQFWNKVIRHILLIEEHVSFSVCLEEFVNDGVNGTATFWKNGIELWKEICDKTRNKKILVDSLLSNIAKCTCNLDSTKKMWSILIESYMSLNDESGLMNAIQDNIELVFYGNRDDFFRVTEIQFLKDKLIPALESFKLTNLHVREVGKRKLKEAENKFEYKLDDWIGIN